jgi:hypothetical protein
MSAAKAIAHLLAVAAALIAAFFIGWIWAFNSPRAHVFVRNQSGATLSNLTISGSCEQRHLDTVGDRSEWQTVTRYRKGGKIQFGFSSGATRYSSISEIYTNHSGSCGITLTVLSNMSILSDVSY